MLLTNRIHYFKEREEYVMDWIHSDFCNKLIKEEHENKAEIEAEVNNYKEFRKELKDWIDKNPIIKYRDFKKKQFPFILDVNVILKSKKIHLKIYIIHGEMKLLYIKNMQYLN